MPFILAAACDPVAFEDAQSAAGDAGEVAMVAQAIAGSANRLKVAIDAPWRIEPGPADEVARYGEIPVVISIYDAAKADAETVLGEEWESVLRVRVRERHGSQVFDSAFTPAQFHEIEKYVGPWEWTATPCDPTTHPDVENNLASNAFSVWHNACPEAPRGGYLCRLWKGPLASVCAGASVDPSWILNTSEWHAIVMVPIQGPQTPGRNIKLEVTMDVVESDTIANDVVGVTHVLNVRLGQAPLPKFSDQWAYGDLHYHSQVTANFGEFGSSFRGALQAMSAVGLDFAFATDHTSNNRRIWDILHLSTDGMDYYGLGDASPTKWSYGHWSLNDQRPGGDEGANREVLSYPRLRSDGRFAAPQLFLGGEVDVIPETWDRSVVGFSVSANRIESVCAPDDVSDSDCSPDNLTVPAGDGNYLIRDFQGVGLNTYEHFARQHLIHLPHGSGDRGAGIMGNTSQLGGATRRLGEIIEQELEAGQKGYVFLAHPFEQSLGTGAGRRGPDIIPYSSEQLRTALHSEYVLGLQFWNENSHFKTELGGVNDSDTLNPFNASGWLHTQNDREGWLRSMAKYTSIWDHMLVWGLDSIRTAGIAWLRPGQPRRFFMAGGSDAHGDFNYRREGRTDGVDEVTDTAIGSPRNLVHVGPPRGNVSVEGLNAATFTQEQVVEALRSGEFSITDGPALQILIDQDRNGIVSEHDVPMGGVTYARFPERIPVLVQWKSTPEFGPLEMVSLYVGVQASGVGTLYQGEPLGFDFNGTTETVDDTYYHELEIAPSRLALPGVAQQQRYLVRPFGLKQTTSLRFTPAAGEAFEGQRLVWLDPALLKVGHPAKGEVAQNLFVRAVGTTTQTYTDLGVSTPRTAFTNPVWVNLEDRDAPRDVSAADLSRWRSPRRVFQIKAHDDNLESYELRVGTRSTGRVTIPPYVKDLDTTVELDLASAPHGNATMMLIVRDTHGHETTQESTYYIDRVIPSVCAISGAPATNASNGISATLSGYDTGLSLGTAIQILDVWVDGQPFFWTDRNYPPGSPRYMTPMPRRIGGGQMTVTVPNLTVGSHTLVGKCVDGWGNERTGQTTVTVGTPPTVHAAVQNVTYSGFTLNAVALSTASRIDRIEVRENGGLLVEKRCGNVSSSCTASWPVTGTPGQVRSLELRAIDREGWWGQRSLSVTLPLPPAPQISNVVKTGPYRLPKFTVSTSWANRVTVALNGTVLLSDSSPPYEFPIDLSSWPTGTYPLVFTAHDPYGRQATADYALFADNTPPIISLVRVIGTRPPFLIDADVFDNSLLPYTVTFMVDGVPFATTTNSPNQASYSPSSAGPHTLTVEMRDAFLNTATQSLSAPQDEVPPELALAFSASGGPHHEVHASDTCGLMFPGWLYLDGVFVGNFDSVPYSHPWHDLAPGPHVVAAEITDGCGNTAYVEEDLDYQNLPPEIRTLSVDDAMPKRPKLLIDAIDDVGVVQIEISRGGSLIAHLDAPPWVVELDTSSWPDGEHTVTVRAFDDEGETDERSVTIFADNTNPTFNVVPVHLGVGMVRWTASASDASSIADVSLGGGVPFASVPTTHFTTPPYQIVTPTPSQYNQADHWVFGEATDEYGNKSGFSGIVRITCRIQQNQRVCEMGPLQFPPSASLGHGSAETAALRPTGQLGR